MDLKYNILAVEKFNLEDHFKKLNQKFPERIVSLTQSIFDATQIVTTVPIEAVLFQYRNSGIRGNNPFVKDSRTIIVEKLYEYFSPELGPTAIGVIINRDHASSIHLHRLHGNRMDSKSKKEDYYRKTFEIVTEHLLAKDSKTAKPKSDYTYDEVIKVLELNGISHPLFPKEYLVYSSSS